MTRAAALAASTLLALALAGCAPDRPPLGRAAGEGDAPALRIAADADANGRRPVALDVVRVADADLARRLEGMDARTWFRDRAGLVRDGAGRIAVTSWEMVPGQTVQPPSLPPFAATPVATVVYARYAAPGAHRQSFPGAAALDIRLERDGFTAQPLPAGRSP